MLKYYVFAILLVGFFLRFYKLDNKPLHFDEASSVACALGIPYAGINQVGSSKWTDLGISPDEFTPQDFQKYNNFYNVYRATIQDNGSILYFLTLHYWLNIFGTSPFSGRFLSLFFSCLTILITYYFAKDLTNSSTIALFSMIFIALNPLSIASGQFCRSHAMAGFFTISASFLLIKIFYSEKIIYKSIIAYGILCTFAMLCHYFTMYIFLGHFLVILILNRKKNTFINFGLGGLLSVILFVIWLVSGGLEGLSIVSIVHEQFYSQSKNWVEGDNPYFIPSTPKHLLGGSVQVLLPIFGNYLQLWGWRLSQLVILLIIPFSLIFCGFYILKKCEGKRIIFSFLGLVLMGYFVWAYAMSLRMGYMIVLQPLYAQYIVPYACVLLALALFSCLKSNTNVKFITYFFICFQIPLSVLSIYGNYFINVEKIDSHQVVANKIEKEYQKGDVVVYKTWNQAYFVGLALTNKKIKQAISTESKEDIYIKRANKKIQLKN
jgi:uncharacterized membrane protein